MKIKMNQKGFTLIELLIVVAIIAILAAIAIPQFSAYRVRGFNASGNSDVRNLATAQEALFADTQGYGSIVNAALAAGACTATSILPGQAGGYQAATTGTAGAKLMNSRGSLGFAMGNAVTIGSTGVVDLVTTMCSSYILVSKHTAGDRCFGRDTDSSSMYAAAGTLDIALLIADVPVATTGTIDITAGLTQGICSNWQSL